MADTGEKLKVFISYSRRDAAEFADELVAGLELAGFAPFLDRHDIAAGEDWEARLGGLIAQSDTVVFVVTPEAVKSERCVWEVEHALADSKRLLPVVYKSVPDADIPQALSRLQFVRFDGGRGVARPLAELAEALRLDLDWIREHTRLGELAARWSARGRPESLLLRGDDLAAAKAWVAQRKAGAPEITDAQRALLLASDEAESERLGKERAQIEEMRHAQESIAQAQAATAKHQKRIGWLLRGVAALLLAIFGYLTWQSYEVAQREIAVFTSLATQAMNDGHFDRATRYALQAYPARGSIPWLTPFSSELEGKLAGGAQSTALERVLRGHGRDLRSVSYSPDGSRIVTCGDDETARVFDARSGEELLLLKGPDAPVLGATFTPDGKGVALALGDSTARIYDAADGRELMVLKGHEGAVYQVVFDHDGKRIATVSRDTTARIWDAATGRELAVLKGHTAAPDRVSFSASGERLATLSREESAVRVWEVASARQLALIKAPTLVMWEAMLNPAGTRLVTTELDKDAHVWDVDSGTQVLTLTGYTSTVWQVAFDRAGKRILTAGDNTARIYDAETGKELQAFKVPTETSLRIAMFSPDERRIATASGDDTARVWDVGTNEVIAQLKGHTASIAALAFSPDGKELATASNDATARTWQIDRPVIAVFKGHTGSLNHAAFSRDGRRVVTASADNTARIWDAETGREMLKLEGHTASVLTARFDPAGKRVVTASSDGTVRIWSAEDGKVLFDLREGSTAPVDSATFDRDGKYVAAAGRDSKAHIWDAATGKQLFFANHPGWLRSIAFSPDGARIVTTTDRDAAFVWTWHPFKEIVTLTGHTRGVKDAVFDHDGKRVLTGSWDGTARIWDAETGKELVRFQHPKGAGLPTVQFDPQEKLVVTATLDGSAVIWDIASGQDIVALPHSTSVNAAAFSPDGRHVLTVSGNEARIWDVTWAARVRGKTLRERVCAEKLVGVAQEFTDAELANPILRGIDRNDPIARNPCLRRGPLTLDYWTRLPGQLWQAARAVAGKS